MRRNLTVVLFLIAAQPCAWAHTDVTVAEARDLIDTVEDLVVVDVREPYEYCDAVGHISGALNYPLSSGVLQACYEELPMDHPILVVCRSGGRSNAAANLLDSQGFSEVYDMAGGMNAWLWDTVPCKYAGGSGTAEDPYQIATAADLIALGETPDDYDKHFIQTADIDLDPNLPGRKVFDRAVIAPDVNDAPLLGWEYDGTPFTGVFDGDGHIISHLTITDHRCVGLFGVLGDAAMVSNLGLEMVDVNATEGLGGGLAGVNNGSITTSYSSGTVTGGFVGIGGLVGYNSGSIVASHSRGAAMCTSVFIFYAPSSVPRGNVGGLVGSNSGCVTASYSSSSTQGFHGAGGLVGYIDEGGCITASYSTGRVSGTHQVGGLVGCNIGHIAASYSTGAVSGDSNVGGLVGRNNVAWGRNG